MASEDAIARRIADKFAKMERAKIGNAWVAGNDRCSFTADDGTTVKARGSVRGPAIAVRRDDGDWQAFPAAPEGDQSISTVIDRRDRPKPAKLKFTFTIGFGGIRYPSE